jgi:hypothetical protein
MIRICVLDFIPISAENAFIYRTVSKLDFDSFTKLDKDFVEKLGRDEVGKSKWRSLTPDEKYLAAYEAVTCETYKLSYEDTNFDEFLQTFALRVGGNDAQLSLIEKQLELKLEALSFDKVVAQELTRLSRIHRALFQNTMTYKKHFWVVYSKCVTPHIASFKSNADHLGLQIAMEQLSEYAQFVEEDNKNGSDERKKIAEEMMSLVRLQLHALLEHAKELNGWTKDSPSLYRELYEWDVAHNCWVDLTTCGPSCTEGFECRSKEHLVWGSHKGAPGQWERRLGSGGGYEWHNAQTGQTVREANVPGQQSASAPAPTGFGGGVFGASVQTGGLVSAPAPAPTAFSFGSSPSPPAYGLVMGAPTSASGLFGSAIATPSLNQASFRFGAQPAAAPTGAALAPAPTGFCFGSPVLDIKFDNILKPPPTDFSSASEFGTEAVWTSLTPKDFCAISESILLLSYSRMFCSYFGREKVLLERIVSQYNDLVHYLDNTYAHLGKGCKANLKGKSRQDTLLMRRAHTLLVKALQGSHNDKGEFVPKYPHQYKMVVHVEMPRRLSDPSHWGHLAWQFCEFMDAHPSYSDLMQSA